MLEIKVNKTNGDYFYTKINASLEEMAKYYFRNSDVATVEILGGGEDVNEFRTVQPLKLYRETPETINKYDLFYDVRLVLRTTYKQEQPFGFEDVTSIGFVRTIF